MRRVILSSSLFVVFIALTTSQSSGSVAIGDVPQCARTCLSNSTTYATDCVQIDVKCLCGSPNYVSALSCCLAQSCNTSEQQIAIQFNVQECTAVNVSAPNFVGCSPFSLSLSGSSLGQATASSAKPVNSLESTVSGDVITELASYSQKKPTTATFAGKPLLTGSCSVPFFAQVTIAPSTTWEYPQIGCAPNRENCCPFDSNENAVLTQCPQDYFTTSGACCPLGYQVYYTAIGAETPCYSSPSLTLVPATVSTPLQLTLITDHIFARRYVLANPNVGGLGPAAIAGITVGAVAATIFLVTTIWCLRRRKVKQQSEANRLSTTFPPTEPTLTPMGEIHSPQELASPSLTFHTPTTPRAPSGNWPFPHPPFSPPAYENATGRPVSLKTAISIPQELPGSTHIHEHHPAFTGSQTDLSTASPPRTPTRTVNTSSRSPVLSTGSPLRTASPGTSITPLSSPRFREAAM